VSLTNRLFGRSAETKLDLALIQGKVLQSVRASGPPDIDLTRARLADHYRSANILPVLPEEFDRAAERLDTEGQRRLAVLVSLLDLEQVRAVVAQLAGTWPVYQIVSVVFTGLAEDTPLLSIEVLNQSEQRVEELARRFLSSVRAGVIGESAEESKKRLHKLDYARLLDEAAKARASAAERAERLRQLQEQQEQRRGRRGKW
jgi:hypothetical protein